MRDSCCDLPGCRGAIRGRIPDGPESIAVPPPSSWAEPAFPARSRSHEYGTRIRARQAHRAFSARRVRRAPRTSDGGAWIFGVPALVLIFGTLLAWLRAAGLSLEVIRFFSLVTLVSSVSV